MEREVYKRSYARYNSIHVVFEFWKVVFSLYGMLTIDFYDKLSKRE